MDKKTKAKKTIPDTICRVHRSGGYAVLSNCFVRSTNIGCDSIGLLGKINDLPPTWNFTIAGLVAICEDGETAIKSQLAELEQWGYVKKTLLMPNDSPNLIVVMSLSVFIFYLNSFTLYGVFFAVMSLASMFSYMATLELVNAIIDVALDYSEEGLHKLSWSEFVSSITEPELIAYLKERRLYINEIEDTEEDM